MKTLLREQAVNLRTERHLSYSEIRKKLGVPKSTLSYWLQEYPLTTEKILELRRKGWKKGEASRERYRITMRKKQEAINQEIYKKYKKIFCGLDTDSFFLAGLMLYWGEGDKRNRYRLGIANTDKDILILFIKWATRFLKVNPMDFRAQLHLYENMNIAKETEFWRNELALPKRQFYKTQIRKVRDNTYSYKGPLRHGTCSIFVLGGERKREVMMAIKAFLDKARKVL